MTPATPCGPDLLQLTIQFTGNGVGAIDFGFGPCSGPGDCGQAFGHGQTVNLVAIEDGAEFQSWGGACDFLDNVVDPDPFNIVDHMICTAHFGTPLEEYTLDLHKDRPEGADGRVWSAAHIQVLSNPTACSATFRQCTMGSCGEQRLLTIVPSTDGRVWSEDGGINCGTDCSHSYSHAFSVYLHPDPHEEDWSFDHWVGCNPILQSDGSWWLLMGVDETCTPHFQEGAPVTYDLSVELAGEGTGTVVDSHGAISCEPDCHEVLGEDAPVFLIPEADPSYQFVGWNEECPGNGDGNRSFNMSGHTECVATFEEADAYVIDIHMTASRVFFSPPGPESLCQTDCTSPAYEPGTVVIVQADPYSEGCVEYEFDQ